MGLLRTIESSPMARLPCDLFGCSEVDGTWRKFFGARREGGGVSRVGWRENGGLGFWR
jgi:hypothetical protein